MTSSFESLSASTWQLLFARWLIWGGFVLPRNEWEGRSATHLTRQLAHFMLLTVLFFFIVCKESRPALCISYIYKTDLFVEQRVKRKFDSVKFLAHKSFTYYKFIIIIFYILLCHISYNSVINIIILLCIYIFVLFV